MESDRNVDVFQEKIETAFSELTPKLRQAARYILQNPDHVAMYSMRELARRAGVEPPTMLRLAQRLGFEGFGEARDITRAWLQTRDNSFSTRAKDLPSSSKNSRINSVIEEVFSKELRNIKQFRSNLDLQHVTAAHNALSRAQTIYVLGLRGMFPAAFYFHYSFSLFSHKTVLLDSIGGTFGDDLRRASKKDALIVFSSRPYARDTLRAIEYAEKRLVQMIAVTDSKLAPVVRENTIALIIGMEPSSVIPSVLPPLAVIQVLVRLAMSSQKDMVAAVSYSENQLKHFEAFAKG